MLGEVGTRHTRMFISCKYLLALEYRYQYRVISVKPVNQPTLQGSPDMYMHTHPHLCTHHQTHTPSATCFVVITLDLIKSYTS